MGNDNSSGNIEKIARTLRTGEPLAANALKKVTGVSQSQLSRYLNAMKDNIVRIGRGKNTKYAHLREIPTVDTPVIIYQVDEKADLFEVGKLYPIHPKEFYWESNNKSGSRIFDDLPYFLNDLRPSGFLGRLIPRAYPDWSFPEDVRFWTAESTLRYLANFGVDLVGNLIVGEKAAGKFLQLKERRTGLLHDNEIDYYEQLTKEVQQYGVPGSSIGGEQPKFMAERLHDLMPVIVKFLPKGDSPVQQRRIDLLRAESIASQLLLERRQSSATRIIEGKEHLFLEIERFDRVIKNGRKGVISLLSLDAEFVGSGQRWGIVAEKLVKGNVLSKDLLEKIELFEYFGELIGNSDMHGGNLSFYFENEKVSGLTPIYDMLPMSYAPNQDHISDTTLKVVAPRPSSVGVWNEAKKLAINFWQRTQNCIGISPKFREIARQNEQRLSESS